MMRIVEVKNQLANYHICPICMNPIEVEKYEEHRKTHGGPDYERNTSKLEQILKESTKSCKEKNDSNPICLFFEIAKRVFSEVEKTDTTTYNYVLDSQYPDLMSKAKVSVPSR